MAAIMAPAGSADQRWTVRRMLDPDVYLDCWGQGIPLVALYPGKPAVLPFCICL